MVRLLHVVAAARFYDVGVVMKVQHADAFVGPSTGCYCCTATAETSVASHVAAVGRWKRENGTGSGESPRERPSAAVTAAAVSLINVTEGTADDGRCDNCVAEQRRSRRPRHRSGSWP